MLGVERGEALTRDLHARLERVTRLVRTRVHVPLHTRGRGAQLHGSEGGGLLGGGLLRHGRGAIETQGLRVRVHALRDALREGQEARNHLVRLRRDLVASERRRVVVDTEDAHGVHVGGGGGRRVRLVSARRVTERLRKLLLLVLGDGHRPASLLVAEAREGRAQGDAAWALRVALEGGA